MLLLNFINRFPDEESCVEYLRLKREERGITCKKCDTVVKHYWIPKQRKWKCSKCGSRKCLRSGTIMEKSKMPIQNWFIIFHLMTSVKKSFSAKEIQKQLERNRYEPVWLLMQKIRIAMGKADARYQLVGDIEIDDAHYEVVLDKKTRLRQPKTWSRQLKRGKGSERQAKVVVMVESRPNPFNKNKHRPSKSLGRIKMATIDHFKYQEINYEVEKAINQEAVILSDGLAGFKRLNEVVSKHVTATVMPTESSKVFPWVNTTISNSKRLLLGTHHSIGKLFLQNYLNEFCYKLNRRNHYIDLFDLLLDDAISMRWNS